MDGACSLSYAAIRHGVQILGKCSHPPLAFWRPPVWSLKSAKRAIVIGGCLGVAAYQIVLSPATILFAQELGAMQVHIGIVGSLSNSVLFMQLLGALLVTRMTHRKPLWLPIMVLQRMVLLPAAIGPWLFPEVAIAWWLLLFISSMVLYHAINHLMFPLWLSWMGDYLPHAGLNAYWGFREYATQLTAAIAVCSTGLLVFRPGTDIKLLYMLLILFVTIIGVTDILLFLRIEEPAVSHGANPGLWAIVSGPFRRQDFRSFILFNSFFTFAVNTASPFMPIYIKEYLGIPGNELLIMWSIFLASGAVCARQIGRWTERFGQRPVLILSVSLKSINVIAFLLLPAGNPRLAFWVLLPVFCIDSILNIGYVISTNGFMIKNSPRENRAMYIAAGNGFAGIVGGITAVAAGIFLDQLANWRGVIWGRTLVNFHLVFAISLLLRLIAIYVAWNVHEPASHKTRHMLAELFGLRKKPAGLSGGEVVSTSEKHAAS